MSEVLTLAYCKTKFLFVKKNISRVRSSESNDNKVGFRSSDTTSNKVDLRGSDITGRT